MVQTLARLVGFPQFVTRLRQWLLSLVCCCVVVRPDAALPPAAPSPDSAVASSGPGLVARQAEQQAERAELERRQLFQLLRGVTQSPLHLSYGLQSRGNQH